MYILICTTDMIDLCKCLPRACILQHMCMPSNSCSISKRSPEEPWFASKKGGARSRHKSHNARTRTCDSMCSAVRHKSMVVTESWSRLGLDHLLHFSPFHFLASRTHHGRKCSHGCVRWADDEHQWWKKGTGRSGTNPRRPHLVGFHSCCVFQNFSLQTSLFTYHIKSFTSCMEH